MIIQFMMATIALIGGTLWTGTGERIEGATVLIEGNKVIQVGRKIPIPTGAIIKECHGRVITPGFIDAYTQLGLVEISGVGSANDTRPKIETAIRVDLKASDAINPNSYVLKQQIEYGVLSAGTHLSGGLISGQISALNLVDGLTDSGFKGINLRLGGQVEQSRAIQVARLREAFEQAKVKRTQNLQPREQLPVTKLRILSRIMSGEGGVFVEAHRQSDIELALELSATYTFKLTIVGGQEAWRLANRLAKTRTPVIINPVQNSPTSFDRLLTHPRHLSILIDAGVEVALSTFSTHQVRKLRQWAGNAIRAGMPYQDAVRAVTIIPAKLLSLPQAAGIQPGAHADIVVWSGDPFELSSFPTYRIKNGRAVNLSTRQNGLFQRYRCLNSDDSDCQYKLPADTK